MSNPKPARVVSAISAGTKEAEGLTILTAVCEAGAQCAEVTSSPVASAALGDLKNAVTTANTSLALRLALATQLMTAIKGLRSDYQLVRSTARTYQTAVAGIAKGDAKIINKAGLKSEVPSTTPVPLDKVTKLSSKPGKHTLDSILSWAPGPGATGYAIEVNFTPQNPAGPWIALVPGTGRRRIVKGPIPGGQFLARVASLGTGGTQSEWSDPILCTAAF